MKRVFGILALLLILPFMPVLAQERLSLAQNGAPHQPSCRVTGKVVDVETGEPIIGARVFIEGSTPTIGAVTDLNGSYTLRNVPPGTHTVTVTYPEYAKVMLTGLTLAENETRQEDISLKPEIKQVEGEAVEVVAKVSRGSSAGLLKDRQKAAAVSDAIGAEEMSRTGSSDAAQAMSKVTGTTIVDGKYVYVRGLGERYSTTQLNGAELPSTDPNKRAVHLDLFASNLLENIVTVKSYTPDKPGNFTGGSVNMVTKSYPDHFNANFSLSSAYNTQFSLEDGFLTYPGGHQDWLGMDDGTRDIPAIINDPSISYAHQPSDIVIIRRDSIKASQEDLVSKAFNSDMAPTKKMAPLNRNFAFSLGDQVQLLGRPLGFLGSLSYTRGFNSYTNGTAARWQLLDNVNDADSLVPNYLLNDYKSADEVVWGGLANLTYQPHPKHELKTNYMYNRSGESTARYLYGSLLQGGGLTSTDIYETRVLQYVERSLGSFQLSGHHALQALLGMDLNWSGSLAKSKQNEPDLRYFSNHYSVDSSVTPPDTSYDTRTNAYPVPTRIYRNLNEDNAEFNLDFSIPFEQWSGLGSKLKLGGYLLRKERTFRERRFEIWQDLSFYEGDPETYFSDTVMGIYEQYSGGGTYRFGNYVVEMTDLSNNYDADQKISAVFAMLDFPILRKLRFAGGVRLEITRMFVGSKDTADETARLSNDDWLPSANLIYQLRPDMNLRTSYSRTLARPEFRELAPYSSFDFVGDEIYGGNSDLKRTLIHNYDLRWEWFERPGELYSISGFYKRFIDPIERINTGDHKEVSSRNVPEANVYGLELEVRKRLDKMGSFLQHFQVGTNLTLVHSQVDIDSVEFNLIKAYDPNPPRTRQLQGQSPYILNLDLSYGNYKSGTTATLLYNVFGRRLAQVSKGDAPNVFEAARGQLDFTLSQRILKSVTFKGSLKNLLNSEYKKVYPFKGTEYPYRVYKTGRTLSFGFNWAID